MIVCVAKKLFHTEKIEEGAAKHKKGAVNSALQCLVGTAGEHEDLADFYTQPVIDEARKLWLSDYATETFIDACEFGKVDVVRKLLRFVSPNEYNGYGQPVLYLAARWSTKDSSIDVVRMLLAHPDINVNAETRGGGVTALSCVVRDISKSSIETLCALLEHPNIDVNLKCPLLHAARHSASSSSFEVLLLLLEHPNINIHVSLPDGWWALLLMFRFTAHEHLMTLLKHLLTRNDVDWNVVNVDGWGVIAIAARYWPVDAFTFLLQQNLVDYTTQNVRDRCVSYAHAQHFLYYRCLQTLRTTILPVALPRDVLEYIAKQTVFAEQEEECVEYARSFCTIILGVPESEMIDLSLERARGLARDILSVGGIATPGMLVFLERRRHAQRARQTAQLFIHQLTLLGVDVDQDISFSVLLSKLQP